MGILNEFNFLRNWMLFYVPCVSFPFLWQKISKLECCFSYLENIIDSMCMFSFITAALWDEENYKRENTMVLFRFHSALPQYLFSAPLQYNKFARKKLCVQHLFLGLFPENIEPQINGNFLNTNTTRRLCQLDHSVFFLIFFPKMCFQIMLITELLRHFEV